MGKRYHCELCDKTFPDNPKGRKNHNQGISHQQNLKLHYDSFRDTATIINEHLSSQPCRNFIHLGTCQFGDRCKYSHLTDDAVDELEKRVSKEIECLKRKASEKEPMLDDWLRTKGKYINNTKSGNESTDSSSCEDIPAPVYQLPDIFVNIPNLPPSILPPTSDSWKDHEHNQWG